MSGWRRILLLLALSMALLVCGQILLPGFLSLTQVANQTKIAAFLGLFALCQTLAVAAGGQGLDLSMGAVATLGGVLGTALLPMVGAGVDPVAGTVAAGCAAVVAGLLAGVLNGVGIALLGVPPLVATLALASVIDGGLIVGVSIFAPNNAAAPAVVAIAGGTTFGVPNIVLVWLIVTVVALWLLLRSAWGRRLSATGSNATTALLSGTNTVLVRTAAYTLSGGVAAATGFLLTGYVGQAFLGLGNTYVLTSIVAAAIGGVALEGGRAPYLGVVCAAIMMTVLVSLLTAVDIGESGRQIIFGLTLLMFLIMDRRLRRAD
jgi:ribose transport system permease protein